jgi:short subunit dehydrogenase-like uncharacterized protein
MASTENRSNGTDVESLFDARDYDSRPDTYEHIGKVRGYVRAAVSNLLVRADRHDASKLVDPDGAVCPARALDRSLVDALPSSPVVPRGERS